MDWLSRIFDWLREQEAGFSAMAAIAVLAGILFTGLRLLVCRRSEPAPTAIAEAAKDGTHLWADSYDREVSASDIFEVQDAVTEQVVATIAGRYKVFLENVLRKPRRIQLIFSTPMSPSCIMVPMPPTDSSRLSTQRSATLLRER